jgi:TPP-dependent pyruvate/acetoin dehydrogenase alpha subunit
MPAKKENPRELIDLLRRMWLIRAFEEKSSALYAERQIVGLLHLGIGQEAVAVGACSLLRNDDYVYGGHRSHGHAIAKGADINKLMAEIAGRATGYCGGKGGSMHIVAKETGFITATGVVGGTIPLALGAAFAAKEKKQRQVAVVFFGDGAGQAGPFHESLNIASLWRLPVIFVCENNGYAEFTPMSAHTVVSHVSVHGQPYGIPAQIVDGNDTLAVLEAGRAAVARARDGGGPTIVECLTYRLRGHYVGDPAAYRKAGEVAEWRDKDPVRRFTALLQQRGTLAANEVEAIEAAARARVEDAVSFMTESPWPAPRSVADYVYA